MSGFHPKRSTLRLYTEGRQGRVYNEHQGYYPGWNKDQYAHRMMAPSDELLSEYLGQHKPGGKEQLEASWKDKPLHCMDHSQIQEVSDIGWKSLAWKTAQERQRPRSTTPSTPNVDGEETQETWETPASDTTAETYILVFIK